MQTFGFITRNKVDMQVKNNWRETDSSVLKSDIIGRGEDKKKKL